MRITKEIEMGIFKARETGAKQHEIAAAVGISISRVSQILAGKRLKTPEERSASASLRAVKHKFGRKRVLDYAEIRELASDNVSPKEIAELVGCSVAWVRKIVSSGPDEGMSEETS